LLLFTIRVFRYTRIHVFGVRLLPRYCCRRVLMELAAPTRRRARVIYFRFFLFASDGRFFSNKYQTVLFHTCYFRRKRFARPRSGFFSFRRRY